MQFKAGVDKRMDHDPARIRLECVLKDLPRATPGQRTDIAIVVGSGHEAGPSLDGGTAAHESFAGELASNDAVLGMLADVEGLGVCSKHCASARCHAGGVAESSGELSGREVQQLCDAGSAAEGSGQTGDVPVWRIN